MKKSGFQITLLQKILRFATTCFSIPMKAFIAFTVITSRCVSALSTWITCTLCPTFVDVNTITIFILGKPVFTSTTLKGLRYWSCAVICHNKTPQKKVKKRFLTRGYASYGGGPYSSISLYRTLFLFELKKPANFVGRDALLVCWTDGIITLTLCAYWASTVIALATLTFETSLRVETICSLTTTDFNALINIWPRFLTSRTLTCQRTLVSIETDSSDNFSYSFFLT